MALDAKEIEYEIEEAKTAIRDGFDGIKKSLDVKEKIRDRPVESVAIAGAIGLMVGMLTFRKDSPNQPSGSYARRDGLFREEIGILKGALAATVVSEVAALLSGAIPKARPLFTGAARIAADQYGRRALR